MNIEKMTASFGTLRDSVLELDPGLNVIEAPNESGKTTWCVFLRTMLYGPDGRRSKEGKRLEIRDLLAIAGDPMRRNCCAFQNSLFSAVFIFINTRRKGRYTPKVGRAQKPALPLRGE